MPDTESLAPQSPPFPPMMDARNHGLSGHASANLQAMTDGGPDAPENVAAICPNCHKEIHHGMEGRTKNDQLIGKIAQTEKELLANPRGPFT